ncbi:collagen alpha-1(II) chain-like [Hyperolius riggenbachi]|uniref:collagen alpha-1(II) chain-like n=1 Tax=Hyperolius riggenbachi TaxID=752182 RepID=UPI0035A29D61
MEELDSLMAMLRSEAAARGPEWVAQQIAERTEGAASEQAGRVSARISRPPERLSPSASPAGQRRGGSPGQATTAPPARKNSAAGSKVAGSKRPQGDQEVAGPSGMGPSGGKQRRGNPKQSGAAASNRRSGLKDTRGNKAAEGRRQREADAPTPRQSKRSKKDSNPGSGKKVTAAKGKQACRPRSSSSDSSIRSAAAGHGRSSSPSPPRQETASGSRGRSGRNGSLRGQSARDGDRQSEGSGERRLESERRRSNNRAASPAVAASGRSDGNGGRFEAARPRGSADRDPRPVQPDNPAPPILVWIFGHSYVAWGARRAAVRPDGRQLGIPRATATVRWIGIPGMQWAKVLPELQRFVALDRAPEVLVLHVGGNDLASRTTRQIIQDIKCDFMRMRSTFPRTIIVWSEIIGRSHWRLARSVDKINRARKKLNREVSRFVVRNGGVAVRHEDLEEDLDLFLRRDGVHLNAIGTDLWSLALEGGIQRGLRLWAAQG